jgi:putative Mn2+ efflux pump MntP
MAQIAISSLFTVFINLITAILGFFLLQGFEEKLDFINTYKQLLTAIVFVIIGIVNTCIQYEKYLEKKEQRRKLKLENDKLENENIKKSIGINRGCEKCLPKNR